MADLRGAAAEALAGTGVAAVAGTGLLPLMPPAAVPDFLAAWSRLEPDAYLPGGSTFRRRRYGRIAAVPGADGEYRLDDLPGAPFTQSAATIPLYRGAARRFAPVGTSFLRSSALRTLLRFDLDVIGRLEPRAFGIGIHLIRVTVGPDHPENPAPEGRHFDGHLYVAMHLIGRESCSGGSSLVFMPGDDKPVFSTTLTGRLDTLIVDDRRVEHEVSPVRALGPGAVRDMLLVDFDPLDDI
ncbi:hypothetical protein ACWT_1915 [Actinoplanes sp. SE50]|uniref:2OG-Fe dioxygenase family protein n=1 Tax=unclassified Actinoplanes TaxID=2626549 RepID=UPI00023EBEB8|nr:MULTISPECIES: 2OG-Fe dioxygenase family protein [unclassified Actinoplanes]AEV82934.1 hypothetical protein ACPL_2037 [Actinoplanes sp. SE50/110]ATO81330.1 hypothetical protein ACWT_1915 [Actinoplanes sp. SE50]SLL98737.1 hypothetical protein ACSP50_1964 [Actinoplanes sp. SE50/110]